MSMFKRERLAEVEAKTASDQPRHTVLIVDDEDGNLRALRSVLGNDFNILEAKDGQAALELLQALPPDQAPAVILSDQRMPRMTGVELFANLRESLPATIRIIITGFVDVGAIVEAINRAGIYKFVVKPYDQKQLRLTVDRAIEASEERKRIDSQIQGLETKVGENLRKLERNIEALRRAHAEIARAGLVDELTGLGNRRFLINALDGREASVRQAGADPEDSARANFLLVQIDDFAAINERLGSAAGNAVLRQLAALLKERSPPGSILVRLEGATFLLHLSSTDDAMAREFARRVADAVAATAFDDGAGQQVRCTCCIGVAGLPFVADNPGMAGWELALSAANGALRLARRGGSSSVLSLAPAGPLPEGFARAVVADPQALLDANLIAATRVI